MVLACVLFSCDGLLMLAGPRKYGKGSRGCRRCSHTAYVSGLARLPLTPRSGLIRKYGLDLCVWQNYGVPNDLTNLQRSLPPTPGSISNLRRSMLPGERCPDRMLVLSGLGAPC